MQLNILLETVAVMVLLMAVGYIGARRGVFTMPVVKAMSALVFNLFLAAASFNAICSDVPELSGASLVHIMLVLSLTMFIPYIISDLSAALFFRNAPGKAVAALCISVLNTMMFGLPIVQQIYGGTSVMFIGLSCVAGNLLLYSYGVWRMLKGKNTAKKISIKAKDVLSPVLIATMLGLVFLVAELPVPSLVQRFLSSTASATMPMSMVVIGATMASGSLKESFTDKRVYLVSFIKLIVCPLAVWLIVSRLTDDLMLLRTCVVIAGCPSGSVAPVFALQYEHDAVFASRSVIMSTLLAVITLPMFILLMA